ncbi:MAG: hypothetical protein LBR69_07090 [Endomicrobium sp.]|jgi:hypothetical protein|nr:hypothetical protein [Endomicrobium sp.]
MEETNKNLEKRRFLFPVLILAVVTAMVYLGNYSNDYGYYDDYKEIVSNEYVHPSVKEASELFTNIESFHFYVPLKHLANYVLNGISFLNPHISHLFSDFLHIFNVILCYLLIIKLSKSYKTAFLTALMFAVSPVCSNAVNEIAARGHLFTAFFGMLSFYMYILADAKGLKRNQGLYFLAASVLFYLTGLFFWATIILLPVLFAVYEFAKEKRLPVKTICLKISPFLAKAFIVFLINIYISYLKHSAQTQSAAFDNGLIFSLNLFGWQSLYKIPALIADYITYCFVPPFFDIVFAPPLQNFFQSPLKYIFAFVILAAYSAVTVYICKKDKTFLFGAAIFAVFLLPGLVFMYKTELLSLRYMYTASIGIFFTVFVFADIALQKFSQNKFFPALKRFGIYIAVIWFFYAASDSYFRKYAWANPKTVTDAMISNGDLAEVYGWFLKINWEKDLLLNRQYLIKAKETLEKNKTGYDLQYGLVNQNITGRILYIDAFLQSLDKNNPDK